MLVWVDLSVLLRRSILTILQITYYNEDTPKNWRFSPRNVSLSRSFLSAFGVRATLAPALTSSVSICNIWRSAGKPHVGGWWRPLGCRVVPVFVSLNLKVHFASWNRIFFKKWLYKTFLHHVSCVLMWHTNGPFVSVSSSLLSSPELDMFGLILYSVLTFMAVVSVLVFLEECAYIYKKVPSSKKSIIVWVNGAAPVSTVFSSVWWRHILHFLTICFLHFRWSPPCPAWGCGFPDPPCLLTWPQPGEPPPPFPPASISYSPSITRCALCFDIRELLPSPLRVSITQRKLELWNLGGCLWKTNILELFKWLFFFRFLLFANAPPRSPSAISPWWCSSSSSWCWRRWAATRPSSGGQENINWRSARGPAAAAASACHMLTSHGKRPARSSFIAGA